MRWPESTPEETHEWYIANTLIAADAESSTDPRVKSAFFIVEQDGEQLAAPGKLFDSGELKAFVKAELPMEEADHAYSDSIAGNPGKLIIRTKVSPDAKYRIIRFWSVTASVTGSAFSRTYAGARAAAVLNHQRIGLFLNCG